MQASPRDDAAAAIDRATLAGAYFLLADLLEWGPTASLRNAGATSPILAEAMAENGQEELEASHTAVFGLQVFPYAGVFLDPSAQVGAGSTSLQSLFRELGFDPGRSDSGVDHLATLFRALGHASAREASLPGGRECATPLRRCTRDLLDRHVLTWIPPWRSAVRRMEETWPTALAAQCVELVLLHRAELGDCESRPPVLPPLPDLDRKETDLRAIAAALTTPAVAGLFLSRADVRGLARAARVPTGFGTRALSLQNALESAAHYDALPDIVGGLCAIYRDWLHELDVEYSRSVPGLDEATEPWRQRAGEAVALLERIQSAARNAAA